MGSTQPARSAAEALVGPLEVVAELSWSHGGAVVLDVLLADRRRAIVKQHRLERKLLAELHAYRTWVPSLGGRAPEVLAAGDDVLVLARLDASPAPKPGTTDLHRQAGELLRRFHDAAPPQPDDGWAERQIGQLERWLGESPDGLLSADEIDWARAKAAELRDMPPLPLVPCHADFTTRNWLVDAAGHVHLIDFERACEAWWIHDVERLWYREWWERPHLRDALFDGYGRHPSEAELAALDSLGAIGHITSIVWATSANEHDFVAERKARLDAARGVG